MSVPEYSWICSSVTLQSDKRGFFLDFAEGVLELAGDPWLQKFGQLKIDKERILHCYNDSQVKDVVRGTMENIQQIFRGKSGTLAKAKREEAEHFFNKENYSRSILLSNQSVARAPFPGIDKNVDDGLTLPLSIWTRAKAFHADKKYQLALNDIQLALKNKLADDMRLEAYEKMADCFLKIGLKKQSEITLKIVINLAKIKGNKEIEDEYENILKNIDSHLVPETKEDKADLPEIFEGESRAMPYLSSTLSMKRNKEKGRYIVANSKIPTAVTIAVEEPYASVLRFEKNGTHCLHCYKRVEAVVPCPNCSGVAYCSEECQLLGNQYHMWECPYAELMIGSGMSVLCQLSLRIITQSPIGFFLELVKVLGDNLSDHPYLQVYNMETHSKDRDPKDLLYRTLMALLLLQILRNANYFKEHGSQGVDELTDSEITIGCLLLRHLLLTQYNVHEIYESFILREGSKEFKLSDAKIHNIGVGLYPAAAMFNHGCNPLLARYFAGKNLILRTEKAVEQGEEVTENYGPCATIKPLEERKNILKGRYNFICTCTACKENWPTLKELDTKVCTFKCTRRPCKGVFNYKQDGPLENWKCQLCPQENTLKEQVEHFQKLKKDCDRGLDLMEKMEIEDAIEVLTNFINEAVQLIEQPNKELFTAMEALRACWAGRNNFYIL